MAEPEIQTEDEDESVAVKTVTGTEITGDTTESDDQTSTRYKSTDYESERSEDSKKKRSWMDKRYAESWLEKKDQIATSDAARLPGAEAVERIPSFRECFPLGGFQLEHQTRMTVGLDRRRRTRFWRSMRARQPMRIFRRTGRTLGNGNERSWPRAWPYFMRDAAIGLKIGKKEKRKKRRDVFPCDPPSEDEAEVLLREQKSDFANRKELGYVRVPIIHPHPISRKLLVDRAVGERSNLVDGDYVIVELPNDRVYANVVLHGQKGMHLLEMSPWRERIGTWKFDFYQAVVALLAKTQFRYKHIRSTNIDYIYDHAWMLYTHMGTIKAQSRQRLDDVVVYNFKYSVEVEFIQEMEDIAVICLDTDHKEIGLRRQITLNRKDPLQVKVEFGCQKVTDSGYMFVHEDTNELEEWFGKMIPQCHDCIFRTPRFSFAFWQDGLFWYLYNPYRCDEYGFWNDKGHACIVKFCSADSLRRHLMILLLRGYAHRMYFQDDNVSDIDDDVVCFDVQLFNVTYHSCQLDNPKLLQRGMSKQPRRADESDLLEIEDWEDKVVREEDEEDDRKEPRERAIWLRRCRATIWDKCASANWKRPDLAEGAVKARWHQYYVEVPNRLFSLWGEIHTIDDMFDEANRGKQAYACYVVCAGMTTITAPEYWSPKTLDAIVICGNRYYTRSRHEAELKSVNDESAGARHSFKYLSDRFEIGRIQFEARMLPAVYGRLYAESSECLWKTLERVFSTFRFAVLTCESACLGLFKFCGAYYMCDVNSFGPPLFGYGHGAAYLLRATSFRKFMMVLVLTIGSSDRNRFSLNPIEILNIVEMDATHEPSARTREKRHRSGRLVGKTPGKLPRFAVDGQKKKGKKK